MIDPRSKSCTTLAGTGQVGHTSGSFETAQFSEPGGLCVDPEGKTLFVADSNNHMIRVLDLERREVSQVRQLPCFTAIILRDQPTLKVHSVNKALWSQLHRRMYEDPSSLSTIEKFH